MSIWVGVIALAVMLLGLLGLGLCHSAAQGDEQLWQTLAWLREGDDGRHRVWFAYAGIGLELERMAWRWPR